MKKDLKPDASLYTILQILSVNIWLLDATCGFYIQLKIKSLIQNAGSGVLAKAASGTYF